MSQKILVVGGTGMLGKPVVEKLSTSGFEVTVLSTNVEKARGIFPDSVKIVFGDVTKLETLKEPIEGKDFVYINLNAKMTPDLYETIEIGGCDSIVKISKEMGIKRIGYISGASSHGVKKDIIYLDAKVEAENRIINSGVPYSIFRASWFYESLPKFIQQGKALVLGDQPNAYSWLAASDFAQQVTHAFQSDEAKNICFYNGGPEKLTMTEALAKFCSICYPDLSPEKLSFGMAKMLSNLPGMSALKLAIPFFEYFSTNVEDIDTTEADRILGKNNTTVEQWARLYKK